ncbi:MAG TPA: response regulator [Coleofasciculaceae cyanobacterium]|jgi:chemotaxis family two-component system response regulator PixG
MKANNDQIKKIKLQFQNAVDLKQSCKIYVTTAQNDSWSFYFKKGYLIWASSSMHRFRRLYRLTNQICPEINCQDIRLREQQISELWEYLLIAVLFKRVQITIIQAQQVIQAIVQEVLFDCLIAGNQINQVKTIFETQANSMGAILRSSLFMQPVIQIDYKKTIERLKSRIIDWKALSLDCTPNFAPVIKNINKLKQAVAVQAYQKLFIYINGEKTIRDLAIASPKDILEIARSFAPHLKSKAIAMQQVGDRQLTNLYFAPADGKYYNQNHNQPREYIQELELPLIIYVDDNPHTCQQAAQILNPVGYRIILVNDAVKTLMVLLENKPSLIFLNAVMPDANGYELCAQIKKMPDFKNIPLVISRKGENMIDLVRGKMAGVSDFINQPLESTELLTLAQKHTQRIIDYSVN